MEDFIEHVWSSGYALIFSEAKVVVVRVSAFFSLSHLQWYLATEMARVASGVVSRRVCCFLLLKYVFLLLFMIFACFKSFGYGERACRS